MFIIIQLFLIAVSLTSVISASKSKSKEDQVFITSVDDHSRAIGEAIAAKFHFTTRQEAFIGCHKFDLGIDDLKVRSQAHHVSEWFDACLFSVRRLEALKLRRGLKIRQNLLVYRKDPEGKEKMPLFDVIVTCVFNRKSGGYDAALKLKNINVKVVKTEAKAVSSSSSSSGIEIGSPKS